MMEVTPVMMISEMLMEGVVVGAIFPFTFLGTMLILYPFIKR